jgi:hypothetical protein
MNMFLAHDGLAPEYGHHEHESAPRMERQRRASGSIPTLKSRNYFVPGVMVNIIMVVTVMLTAMAMVREKESAPWSS